MNLAGALAARAADQGAGDRPALLVGGTSISSSQVHDGGARTASLLLGEGVRRGDRVLLVLPDGAELVWAFLGAVRLGAVAVPVNPLLPADDHRALADDCSPAAVVCSEELAPRFAGRRIVGRRSVASSVVASDPLPPEPVGADDPAYALYTSGTTGAPRAALHRHGDPLVHFAAFAEPALHLGTNDVVLSVSKMHFAYGLGNSLFFPLLAGAGAVLHPGRPTPEDIVALVARHHVTVLFAVPTFYANLVRRDPDPASLASLRVAVSAGERLTAALAERAAEILGCPLLDSLGSTEVGQAFVGGGLDGGRPGSVGRALPPYEIAVRDDEGRDLPPGVVGMLWVSGPTLLLEYLDRPTATAAAFDGRWLSTGDRASIDSDGFLFHHGRADDMEMVGGITVAPQEIEELLSVHPAVSEVAVAAVADGYGASRLLAFVVPARGAGDERLADELLELARSRLAAYKVPRSVTFVEALPRTPTGKLRRFVLRSGGAAPAHSDAR